MVVGGGHCGAIDCTRRRSHGKRPKSPIMLLKGGSHFVGLQGLGVSLLQFSKAGTSFSNLDSKNQTYREPRLLTKQALHHGRFRSAYLG